MKREQQWDMFDVAIGACELDDYLNQRYQESDLQSKFWVEKEDRVDELRPPTPGTKEQVLIPIQGPGVTPAAPPAQPVVAETMPTRPPWEAPAGEPPMPSRPPWESSAPNPPTAAVVPPAPPVAAPSFPPPSPPTSEPSVPEPSAPEPPAAAVHSSPAAPSPPALQPPNMQELLARFHQAAQAYEERSKEALGESTEESQDPSSD